MQIKICLVLAALFCLSGGASAQVGICAYSGEDGIPIASPCNSYSPDFSVKTVFEMRNGQLVSRSVSRTKTTVIWASDNITRTTRYDYADKSTHIVTDTITPVVTKTVAGMVQTVTTTFGNPKAKPLVTRETGVLIADSVNLSGDFGSKTARYRFSDNTETVVTTNRTKTTVIWASDNITRTTRYDYADKSTHIVTELIEPTVTVTWAPDKITKTTVTVFGNGKTTRSVMVVQPSEPPVQYAEAVYPNTWASGNGGVVTAPSVSARQKIYGNGYIEVLETGTSWQPFLQATLSSRGISDPNSFVQSPTSIYDLRWGTPDPAGPMVASDFRSAGTSRKLAKSWSIAGYKIDGVCYSGSTAYTCGGPTFKRPPDDVLDAWDKGWTGKGSNILVIDSFKKQSGYVDFYKTDFHGIYVSSLVAVTAPNANIWTLDFDWYNRISDAFGFPTVGGKVHSVNMSFDYSNDPDRGNSKFWVSFLQSDVGSPAIQLGDAVLIKAAGNDNKALTNLGPMTFLAEELALNSNTSKRLLLVGALDKDGSVGAKANKAEYSNTPGSDSKFQTRFVMANGTSPFAKEFGWDLTLDPGNGQGTSYAAPRVAGYIGILRHKFPNLNAEKSSSIILDTARTDTLWCHPNCQASIVGRGEASLSRALAPVGRLR